MDAVEQAARTLGHAIQADKRYLAYQVSLRANEQDVALTAQIKAYQKAQLAYEKELQRLDDVLDTAAVAALAQKADVIYEQIMQNPHMVAYQRAKQDYDAMMAFVYAVLRLCENGEDPVSCDPAKKKCGGNCGACGDCDK